MCKELRVLGLAASIGAAVALVVPLAAQEPAAPTKKNPLQFTAFNYSAQLGAAGVTQVTIERWTTDAERMSLLALVETAKPGEPGQRNLLRGLQKIKPRVGFMRTPNSRGWDLRYAVENKMPDGTRQLVIATDKPVSFAAGASNARVLDYPFTIIEMRMKPGEEGEGRMLAASSIMVKEGRLQLENYGQEPVRLINIKEEGKK